MNAPRKRQFLTASGIPTAPTAEPPQDVTTSRRQEVKKSGTQERTAYTWRRTTDQALTMDELTIRLKRELGRPRLDHAEILAALVEIAADSPAVFGALVARLQSDV